MMKYSTQNNWMQHTLSGIINKTMEEQFITFETAKLAKEKGFDVETTYNYYFDETIGSSNSKQNWNSSTTELYSRPTQALLQRWLRKIHKINVESNYLSNIQKYRTLFKPMSIIPKTFKNRTEYGLAVDKYYSKTSHDTYEDALEEGLYKALKLI